MPPGLQDIPPSALRGPLAAGEERRAELLGIAIEVFGESGFAGGRIDQIAARAGIRRPSVLYHFGDKATLYFAAIARVVEEITVRVETTETAVGNRLISIADAWIDFVIERPHAARLLLRQMIDAHPGDSERQARIPLQRLLASIQRAIDDQTGFDAGKSVDASEFSLILSSTSLVWVAGRSAVENVIGLDTLSPEAIKRHRNTLHSLVRQLIQASETGAEESAPELSGSSTRPTSTSSPALR